jgi:hypothetical protein
MHISGDVKVRITVENGNIVNVEASGPAILASAAARCEGELFVPSQWNVCSSSEFCAALLRKRMKQNLAFASIL